MDYFECKKNIDQGRVSPVYFFFGEEPFYADQLINHIIETQVDDATRDFNCDVLQAENCDGDSIVAMASSFPMMADYRVIVVKNVQKLSTNDKKRLSEYAASPLESTILVLTARKIDRRQKFYAGLTKHAQWMESKPLYANQAVDWLMQLMKSKRISIQHDAAGFLVQQVGTSLWNLKNEADKLLTSTNNKTPLTLDDVTAVAGVSRKYNTWELADAVGQKNLKLSVAIMKHLFEENASGPGILITLTQRLLLLIRVRAAMDRQMPQHQMAQSLKLKPFFIKLYTAQAAKYTIDQLTRGLTVLRNADFAIKTGYMKPIMVMTLVLYDLARSDRDAIFFEGQFK